MQLFEKVQTLNRLIELIRMKYLMQINGARNAFGRELYDHPSIGALLLGVLV